MKEIVTLTEDERVYHNHYLTHMKAFLDGDHDLEFLQTLIDKMWASELFLDPIDGWDLIINEMFKYNIRFSEKIRQIAGSLDDYININELKNRKDELRKWGKLWDIADILKLYRVVKTKEYRFQNLDDMILLPHCPEKSQRVDELVKYIVEDTTSSLTLKIGSIIGNDTLLMSIKDSMKLQEMLEGKSRAYDVVKVYSNVVIDQKKFDLPKVILKKEPELYESLERVILDRLIQEFQQLAEEVRHRVGEEKVTLMISSHQKTLQSLNQESEHVKDYIFFMKLVDLIRECFTDEDNITSKFDLSEWYELFRNGELIEELFHKTRLLDRFDDLIYELKNNVFVYFDRNKEYMVLKNAIICLLKKWSKANLAHQGEEIGTVP